MFAKDDDMRCGSSITSYQYKRAHEALLGCLEITLDQLDRYKFHEARCRLGLDSLWTRFLGTWTGDRANRVFLGQLRAVFLLLAHTSFSTTGDAVARSPFRMIFHDFPQRYLVRIWLFGGEHSVSLPHLTLSPNQYVFSCRITGRSVMP